MRAATRFLAPDASSRNFDLALAALDAPLREEIEAEARTAIRGFKLSETAFQNVLQSQMRSNLQKRVKQGLQVPIPDEAKAA